MVCRSPWLVSGHCEVLWLFLPSSSLPSPTHKCPANWLQFLCCFSALISWNADTFLIHQLVMSRSSTWMTRIPPEVLISWLLRCWARFPSHQLGMSSLFSEQWWHRCGRHDHQENYHTLNKAAVTHIFPGVNPLVDHSNVSIYMSCIIWLRCQDLLSNITGQTSPSQELYHTNALHNCTFQGGNLTAKSSGSPWHTNILPTSTDSNTAWIRFPTPDHYKHCHSKIHTTTCLSQGCPKWHPALQTSRPLQAGHGDIQMYIVYIPWSLLCQLTASGADIPNDSPDRCRWHQMWQDKAMALKQTDNLYRETDAIWRQTPWPRPCVRTPTYQTTSTGHCIWGFIFQCTLTLPEE